MTFITVINDVSFFGPEDPAEDYAANQLQTSLLTKLEAMYPGVTIQVWDGDSKTQVKTDGDREVESQVMEVIKQTWLEQNPQ